MTRRTSITTAFGLTLASAARDRSGRLLIPGGVTLEDKHLRVLQSWGISHVEIQDDSVPASSPDPASAPPPASVAPEIEAQVTEILTERFRHCVMGCTPTDSLYHLARRALIAELTRQPSHTEGNR